MAYVLGYLYADGNLEDSPKMRGKYIKVSSIDLESIERIKDWLSSEHTIVKQKSSWKNGKLKYLLRIGNKYMYSSLLKLGLYPNKSLTITFPEISKRYRIDFIRGYFDGDGCIYPYMLVNEAGKKYCRKLSVIFTSGSSEFLDGLSKVINQILGIKIQKILKSVTAYQLRYSTTDSTIILHALYKNCKKGDYLERKYQKFKYFLSLR